MQKEAEKADRGGFQIDKRKTGESEGDKTPPENDRIPRGWLCGGVVLKLRYPDHHALECKRGRMPGVLPALRGSDDALRFMPGRM